MHFTHFPTAMDAALFTPMRLKKHAGCGAAKARHWQRWATAPLNERQVKVLNRPLDGFEGKLTNRK